MLQLNYSWLMASIAAEDLHDESVALPKAMQQRHPVLLSRLPPFAVVLELAQVQAKDAFTGKSAIQSRYD
jgi:hypothetical protein